MPVLRQKMSRIEDMVTESPAVKRLETSTGMGTTMVSLLKTQIRSKSEAMLLVVQAKVGAMLDSGMLLGHDLVDENGDPQQREIVEAVIAERITESIEAAYVALDTGVTQQLYELADMMDGFQQGATVAEVPIEGSPEAAFAEDANEFNEAGRGEDDSPTSPETASKPSRRSSLGVLQETMASRFHGLQSGMHELRNAGQVETPEAKELKIKMQKELREQMMTQLSLLQQQLSELDEATTQDQLTNNLPSAMASSPLTKMAIGELARQASSPEAQQRLSAAVSQMQDQAEILQQSGQDAAQTAEHARKASERATKRAVQAQSEVENTAAFRDAAQAAAQELRRISAPTAEAAEKDAELAQEEHEAAVEFLREEIANEAKQKATAAAAVIAAEQADVAAVESAQRAAAAVAESLAASAKLHASETAAAAMQHAPAALKEAVGAAAEQAEDAAPGIGKQAVEKAAALAEQTAESSKTAHQSSPDLSLCAPNPILAAKAQKKKAEAIAESAMAVAAAAGCLDNQTPRSATIKQEAMAVAAAAVVQSESLKEAAKAAKNEAKQAAQEAAANQEV